MNNIKISIIITIMLGVCLARQTMGVSTNLIANPSVLIQNSSNTNKPQNWTTSDYGIGGTNATFTYPNYNTLEIQIPNITVPSGDSFGDARWVFTTVPVVAGDSYNFSDWYKSNAITQIIVAFKNSTNSPDYYLGLDAAPPESNWTEYSDTFVVPYNATLLTIYHLVNTSGILITDNYSLVQFTPEPFNRAIVSITFDNCWENNTYSALPVLNAFGYKATFYLSSTFLNNTHVGVVNGDNDYIGNSLTGIEAINALVTDGQEIGSHSVDHSVALTDTTISSVIYQLNVSKASLENLSKEDITDYAPPFGDFNSTVENIIKEYYSSSRTTLDGYNTKDNLDPYALLVQNMLNTTSITEYQSWVSQAVKDKSWLILVYHCVGDHNTPLLYDTPNESDFAQQMNVIKQSGITVLPVNQALAEAESQIPGYITISTTTTTSSTSTTTVPSTTINATTTIAAPSGGGVSYSSGGSTGDGEASGGSEKPTIINTSYGYDIKNLTQLGNFNISLCGSKLNVVDNFITPNGTGLTINANEYGFNLNQSEQLVGLPGVCMVKLVNVSYIPYLHTVQLEFISTIPNPVAVIKSIATISTTTSVASTSTSTTTTVIPLNQTVPRIKQSVGVLRGILDWIKQELGKL